MKKKKTLGTQFQSLKRTELENLFGGIPYKKPMVIDFTTNATIYNCHVGERCKSGFFGETGACGVGTLCTDGTVTIE